MKLFTVTVIDITGDDFKCKEGKFKKKKCMKKVNFSPQFDQVYGSRLLLMIKNITLLKKLSRTGRSAGRASIFTVIPVDEHELMSHVAFQGVRT